MTKIPEKNPFRPGVGKHPPFLAGRQASLRRFSAMLRAAPEQPANLRLTGLRGVGKTVLLHEFAKLSIESGWHAQPVELLPSHNTERDFAAVMNQFAEQTRRDLSLMARVKAAVGALKNAGTFSISWDEITLSIDPAVKTASIDQLAKLLFDLCRFAVDKEARGLMLLFDEAQIIRDERTRDGEHPLSSLIAAIVSLQRQELPIGLVLCGLPSLAGNLLKARSYTERMFRAEEIGMLSEEEAREAFLEPFRASSLHVEDRVVERVLSEVEGYPYFIQLWGAELWDAAGFAGTDKITSKLLEATTPEIHRRVDTEFFDPRFENLTPSEQDLLLSTAKVKSYPPLLVAELNDVSDKAPSNINVILGRLVEGGLLYRVRKGQYEYTAPKFFDYLQRRSQKMERRHRGT